MKLKLLVVFLLVGFFGRNLGYAQDFGVKQDSLTQEEGGLLDTQNEGVFGEGTLSLAARLQFSGTLVAEGTYRQPLVSLYPFDVYAVTTARLEGNLKELDSSNIGVMAGTGISYFTPELGATVEFRYWVTFDGGGNLDLTPEILGVVSLPYSF